MIVTSKHNVEHAAVMEKCTYAPYSVAKMEKVLPRAFTQYNTYEYVMNMFIFVMNAETLSVVNNKWIGGNLAHDYLLNSNRVLYL